MVLDMSGNVGTQSLAVTIRNLGDEETAEEKRRRKKSVLKEFKIGLSNGVIIGAIALLVVLAYLSITRQEVIEGNGYVFRDALSVGAIVAVSMFLSISLSSVIGATFPILLTKLHVDPAVASGSFITTLNDIVAVTVYYGLTFVAFSVL